MKFIAWYCHRCKMYFREAELNNGKCPECKTPTIPQPIQAKKVSKNKHCCLNCKWHKDCFYEECLPYVEIEDGNHVCHEFEKQSRGAMEKLPKNPIKVTDFLGLTKDEATVRNLANDCLVSLVQHDMLKAGYTLPKGQVDGEKQSRNGSLD